MPVFSFLAHCPPQDFYRLKKDSQSIYFQLVQQVSGGECERGGERQAYLGCKRADHPPGGLFIVPSPSLAYGTAPKPSR